MKVWTKFTAAFALVALAFAGIAPGAGAEVDGKLGYNKGLYYESEDGRFKIKQNFRIQFRVDAAGTNEDGRDFETDFMIRRMKMKTGGHAYEKWMKWGFQMGGSIGRGEREDDWRIEDAWVAFAKNTAADVKAGRYKIPFDREALNSSSALQFVDRSHIREFGTGAGRADGISVGGVVGGIIAYRAGIFQYDDENFDSSNRILFAGRVQANICCGTLEYSSGAFTAGGDYKITPNFAKVPVIAVGVGGFGYTGEDDPQTYNVIGASSLEEVIRNVNYESRGGFTADIAVKTERANIEAAFYHFQDKGLVEAENADLGDDDMVGGTGGDEDTPAVAPATESFSHTAYRVQGGFMLTPEFEVAARWAMADYDSGSGGNDRWEWTAGLNCHIAAKHRAKVQVDYTYGNTEDGREDGKDLKESAVRAQLQIYL